MNKLTILQINCCQQEEGENTMSTNRILNDTKRQAVSCYDENTVYCDWFAWL